MKKEVFVENVKNLRDMYVSIKLNSDNISNFTGKIIDQLIYFNINTLSEECASPEEDFDIIYTFIKNDMVDVRDENYNTVEISTAENLYDFLTKPINKGKK